VSITVNIDVSNAGFNQIGVNWTNRR
jgi:hypothetical protein